MKYLCCCLPLVVAGSALANDADVSFGGTPKLLKGKTSVRMEREKIAMTVGPNKTLVICDFWFKNDGPACDLRVGFPDDGNANEELQDNGKPKSNFDYFKSWVDGKAAKTSFALGEHGVGWHVKNVHFAARASVHIRDEYAMHTGSGIAIAGNTTGACKWARYVVRTGASWKGNIGETEIVVHFSKTLAPKGLRAVSARKIGKPGEESGRDLAKPPFPSAGTIVYSGSSAPSIKGLTLRFDHKNWKPGEKDDLDLWFGFSHLS